MSRASAAVAGFTRVARIALRTPRAHRAVREFKAQGRQARTIGDFARAASAYEQALALSRPDPRLSIHCGHMRKEAGHYAEAEAHYLEALRYLPGDAELALQLGHFYKVSGRIAEAELQYRRATRLMPGWQVAENELAGLKAGGWRGFASAPADQPYGFSLAATPAVDAVPDFALEASKLAAVETVARLVPKLAPRLPEDLLHDHREHLDVRRLGRREVGFWGVRRTVRGVEAIRGFCISETPIVELQLLLNGLVIHRAPVSGGHVLKFERDPDRIRKYVFNSWFDFSGFEHGMHAIELRLRDIEDGTRSFHDHVVIAAPVLESEYPDSDTLVNVDPADPRSIEEQITTRPSVIRSAKRSLLPGGVRNVMVMRTDQLGDMVASIPALRRLRDLLPEAHIVGLLTGANAELARTLALFDEIIVIDFPDDPIERRRLMSLQAQEALRQRLAPYEFDVAIDLAQSNVSRDLLPLSGAKFIHGTGGEDWPWLQGDFLFSTPDRWNRMDMTPHSTKVLALVESLGALLKTEAPVIRRDDLSRALLDEFGIGAGRFAVLHAGARIAFSRWPHYGTLAQMLLDRTDLHVLMMTEDAAMRETLPAVLLTNPRFTLVTQRTTFDQFDALISFATVVVGNDSGPKHLASLRGTNVVTLFTARINWAEWGQENVGSIISRRVPCAGCAIFHDPEECGKDFTCIRDIRPQEVFDAVARYI
ncbi:MAG: hypothetical protein DI605_06930 [Sphingomonas sp.]|nr:MAG: hypothetical protein DI605_06930 [Sphingomonas sp.]